MNLSGVRILLGSDEESFNMLCFGATEPSASDFVS